MLADRPTLTDAHHIANDRSRVFIVHHELFCVHNHALIETISAQVLDRHDNRLLHLVTDDATDK
jgi:hypothetical protein